MDENELNYYYLYLARELRETGDPRQHDKEYIREKADTASRLYEENRLQGMTVDQAQEVAMRHLMSDLVEEDEDIE